MRKLSTQKLAHDHKVVAKAGSETGNLPSGSLKPCKGGLSPHFTQKTMCVPPLLLWAWNEVPTAPKNRKFFPNVQMGIHHCFLRPSSGYFLPWGQLQLGLSCQPAQPSFRLLLPPVFSNLLKMCYSVNPSRVPYCLEGGKQRERKEKKCQPPQGPSTLGNSNHRENAECGCSSQGCSQGPSQSKTQATRNLFLLPNRLSGKPKCVCKTRN